MREFESLRGRINIGGEIIDYSKITEIRWHGRGGQGSVTSAELVAQAAIAEGKYAQGFPNFGPERRGAPVLAFNRVSAGSPIRTRAGIENPDIVVVLDSSLLSIGNIVSTLKTGGIIVINSNRPLDELASKFSGYSKLAVIDASKIALEVLGVPIVNTTMIGALIKASGLVKVESMTQPLEKRFGRLAEKNINAMKKAYEETEIKECL